MEEAMFLSRFGSKVYLIHRRDSFKASKTMQERVLNNPKIEIVYNSAVDELLGAPNLTLGWIGAALWGMGVALGFPLFLSAAGEGENAAKRVGFVASWGYGAFLAGPPILGLLADQIGMLNMFFVIAGFVFVALLVAGAAGSKRA